MSMTRSGIVLALCILSQTAEGAEVRRAAPPGRVPATTPRVTGTRVPPVTGTMHMQMLTETTHVAKDLRPVLAKMRSENRLVEGKKNLVLTVAAQGKTPAFKLWAIVQKSKITEWLAVDANGRRLRTTTRTAVRTRNGIQIRQCLVGIVPWRSNKYTYYEIRCPFAPTRLEAKR